MINKIFILIYLISLIGCQSKTSESTELKTDPQPVKPIVENPTDFGLSSEVINKINNEMGLGQLLKWEDDSDPESPPSYFTTLEYEIKPIRENQANSNNVIELSIASEGYTGKYVEMVKITVGIMNPEDEINAKKLYIQKVNKLSQVLAIEIPSEIQNAIKAEKNLINSTLKNRFEFEVYGATRKWMSLIIE